MTPTPLSKQHFIFTDEALQGFTTLDSPICHSAFDLNHLIDPYDQVQSGNQQLKHPARQQNLPLQPEKDGFVQGLETSEELEKFLRLDGLEETPDHLEAGLCSNAVRIQHEFELIPTVHGPARLVGSMLVDGQINSYNITPQVSLSLNIPPKTTPQQTDIKYTRRKRKTVDQTPTLSNVQPHQLNQPPTKRRCPVQQPTTMADTNIISEIEAIARTIVPHLQQHENNNNFWTENDDLFPI